MARGRSRTRAAVKAPRRKKQGAQGGASRRAPVLAIDRSREAGASALRWYEDELLKITDPRGVWLRAGAIAEVAVAIIAVVVAAALLASRSGLGALCLVAVAAVGLGVARLSQVPVAALQACVLVGLVFTAHPVSGVGVVVAAFVLAALTWLSLSYSREWDAVVDLLVVAALGAQQWASTWVILAVVVLAHVAVEYAQTRSWLLTRSPFVTASSAMAWMPPIKVTAPLLTRMMCLSRKQQDREPRELTRKRAGVWGERRTALLLMALNRGQGTRIVHDVIAPGADEANIDTIVAAKSGWFVIDTKQYGTKSDRGRVSYDKERGVVEFIDSDGARDISNSVRSLMKACASIDALKGEQMGPRPRGVLVVHNAHVDPGIVVEGWGGRVHVDVISADRLLSRIGGSAPLMSRDELAAARVFMKTLTAAAYGGTPTVLSPMGWWFTKVPQWVGPQLADNRPKADGWAGQVVPAPPVSEDAPKSEDEQQWREPAAAPPVPVRRLGPDVDVVELREEAWARMDVAPEAAPDDVSADLRGLQRGERLVHISYDPRTGEPVAQDLVLLKGPCAGAAPDGKPYMWVCAPQEWEGYISRGVRMKPVTVAAENVMRRTW